MRISPHEVKKRICVRALIDESDVVDLLAPGGYSVGKQSTEQTPDLVKENCALEIKCIEEDPIFPNGSLRYLANPDNFIRAFSRAEKGSIVSVVMRFRMALLLTKADRLIKKARRQLRSHKNDGRITGAIIINNLAFSVAMAAATSANAMTHCDDSAVN